MNAFDRLLGWLPAFGLAAGGLLLLFVSEEVPIRRSAQIGSIPSASLPKRLQQGLLFADLPVQRRPERRLPTPTANTAPRPSIEDPANSVDVQGAPFTEHAAAAQAGSVTAPLPLGTVKRKQAYQYKPKACSSCGTRFNPTGPGAARCGPCMTVVRSCRHCGNVFSFRSMGPRNDARRSFCSVRCKMLTQRADPSKEAIWRASMQATWDASPLKGRPSPASSARMKANNPMANKAAVEKMRCSLSGRTFLARGGNGAPTKPQQMLADALGLPMEYAVITAPVKDKFESLPHCYKVDLASPEHRLAIEVDGNTHKQRRWRFLDARKTAVLNALGWRVVRFWNQQVLEDLNGVVREIRSLMR